MRHGRKLKGSSENLEFARQQMYSMQTIVFEVKQQLEYNGVIGKADLQAMPELKFEFLEVPLK